MSHQLIVLVMITCIFTASAVCGLDGEESIITLRLQDLLIFVTGADCIPPLGFSINPVIRFIHSPISPLPTANTCSPSISLPVSARGSSYEAFKDAMVEALVGGFGFGQV